MNYEAKWGVMGNASDQIGKCADTIKSVRTQTAQIKNSLYLTGSPSVLAKIKSELQNCITSLDTCSSRTTAMKNLLADSANTYKSNERKLAGLSPQSKSYNSGSIWDVNFNVKDSTTPSSLWNYLIGKEKFTDSYSFAQLASGGFVLSLLSGSSSFGMESGKGKIKKWEPDDFKTFYEKNSDANFAKSKGGVSIYGIGGSKEGSLIEGRYSGEYGSVGAKFGNAEAHWNADVGMYQYDKNGNKFWSPRVAAEVGASATVFAVDANGNYKFNDYLGVQGKGEVNVGKVEGKAEVKSVLFDKDGNLKPEVKASASAEAIAVEAKGSAGVSVAGVEANVTGKVGVGIGAHADVGYTDGKFKVDVGAYVGVGGSVGFEVDIGGAVDAVCGGAKAAWDWATGWW